MVPRQYHGSPQSYSFHITPCSLTASFSIPPRITAARRVFTFSISYYVLFPFPHIYAIINTVSAHGSFYLHKQKAKVRAGAGPWHFLSKEMILVPGFTTHYLFGVKAYNDLPNNYLKHVISKYRWLYQLGLQGPDIFFLSVRNWILP